MRCFNRKRLFSVLLALLLSFAIFGFIQKPILADSYANVTCSPAPDGSTTSYKSIGEAVLAINSSNNDNFTITVQNDGLADDVAIQINNKNVTIDLNGKIVNTALPIEKYGGNLVVTSTKPGDGIGTGGTINFNDTVGGQKEYDTTIINTGGTTTIDGNVSIAHSVSQEYDDFAISNMAGTVTIKSGFINGAVYNYNENQNNKVYITRDNEKNIPPIFNSTVYALVETVEDGTSFVANAGIFRNAVYSNHIEIGYTNFVVNGTEYNGKVSAYKNWFEIRKGDVVARNRRTQEEFKTLQAAMDDPNLRNGDTIELLKDISEEITTYASNAREFSITGHDEKAPNSLYKITKVNKEGNHTIFDLGKYENAHIHFFDIIFDNNNTEYDTFHFTKGTYEFNNGVKIINVDDDKTSICVEKTAKVIVNANAPDDVENTIEISGLLTHINNEGTITVYNGAFKVRPDFGKEKFYNVYELSTIVNNAKYDVSVNESTNAIAYEQIWENAEYPIAVINGVRSMPHNTSIYESIRFHNYLQVRSDLKDKTLVSLNNKKIDHDDTTYDVFRNGVQYYGYHHVLSPKEYGMTLNTKAFVKTYDFFENIPLQECYYIMVEKNPSLVSYTKSIVEKYKNNPVYSRKLTQMKTCIGYGKAVQDYWNLTNPDKLIPENCMIKEEDLYTDIKYLNIPESKIRYNSISSNYLQGASISMSLTESNKMIITSDSYFPVGMTYEILCSNSERNTSKTTLQNITNRIETKKFNISGNGLRFTINIYDSNNQISESLSFTPNSYLYNLAGTDAETVAQRLYTLGIRIQELYR